MFLNSCVKKVDSAPFLFFTSIFCRTFAVWQKIR